LGSTASFLNWADETTDSVLQAAHTSVMVSRSPLAGIRAAFQML